MEQLGRVLAQQSGGEGEEGKWRGRERLGKLLRNVLGAAARVGGAQELLHNPIAALQVMSSEIMPIGVGLMTRPGSLVGSGPSQRNYIFRQNLPIWASHVQHF